MPWAYEPLTGDPWIAFAPPAPPDSKSAAGRMSMSRGTSTAACTTLGDVLAVARRDFDLIRSDRDTAFDFSRHSHPGHDRLIVDRTVGLPPS